MSEEMTFKEYAKYLNEKEMEIRNAICSVLDVLETPSEVNCTPSINVGLMEVTTLEQRTRQFVITNVTINVGIKF